jgi:dihydropteroate synthase
LLDEGADIIDVGGESTRPGAGVAGGSGAGGEPVSAKEEMERVLPVITALKRRRPEIVISIDTYKGEVARAGIAAGAEVVNDVSGFTWDATMIKTVAELRCGVLLMHTRGRPDQWRTLEHVPDIVTLVKRELRERLDASLIGGIKRERIALDPGFGFGKRFEENYPLLKRFQEFHDLRCPIAVGVSRKSFIGRALAGDGKDAAIPDRLYGTLAAETAAILKGAHIIRTHQVKPSADAARIADIVVA